IDAALEFNRHTGDGRAYADATQVELAQWSSLLQWAGVAIQGGQGRAKAWMALRDKRVVTITLDTLIEEVTLSGAPVGLSNPGGAVPAGAAVPVARLDRFATHARWQRIDTGWRLDAPMLQIDTGNQSHVLDGLSLAGGERYAIVADQLDLAPLVSIAALSDRL